MIAKFDSGEVLLTTSIMQVGCEIGGQVLAGNVAIGQSDPDWMAKSKETFSRPN